MFSAAPAGIKASHARRHDRQNDSKSVGNSLTRAASDKMPRCQDAGDHMATESAEQEDLAQQKTHLNSRAIGRFGLSLLLGSHSVDFVWWT